jgi:hypothetical protein
MTAHQKHSLTSLLAIPTAPSRSHVSIRDWLNEVKTLVEIVAIILAGVWAYNRFIWMESSALEVRADSGSEISWSDHTNDTCIASFEAHIENIGITSFDITKVAVRGWLFEAREQGDEIATYLRMEDLQINGELFFNEEYTDTYLSYDNTKIPFLARYPPGARFFHTFQWRMNHTPGKWVLFRLDFHTKDGTIEKQWYTGRWSQLCAPPNSTT